MRGAVLPGQPRAKSQAVCTAEWNGKRLVAYISGNALVILDSPLHLSQTIYHNYLAPLDSVAIDGATGKIATCSKCSILIYKPYGQNDEALKWSLQSSFDVQEEDLKACSLSWGQTEELLVGSSSLRLFQTEDDPRQVWSQSLPNPASSALLSSDAKLIASIADYDRLVKIWRRLSFGSDEVRFDFSYLPHPAAVTNLHWSKSHQNNGVENVLYTICADNKVRIWASMYPHSLQVLQQWAEIDAIASIQPRVLDPSPGASDRHVFFLDRSDFEDAIKDATQDTVKAQTRPVIEHLTEIATRNPEICVIVDNRGHMCAWGLRNVGGRNKSVTDVFNIAHIENFNIFRPTADDGRGHCARFLGFYMKKAEPAMSLLVHQFDGRISWLEGSIEEFFDPSPRKSRLHVKALWTGHESRLKKIVRNASGRALISRTDDNTGLIWKQTQNQHGFPLLRCSSLLSKEHIHRTRIIAGGHFVVNLHDNSITMWDTSSSLALQVDRCTYEIDGKPLCLLALPSARKTSPYRYLATITSKMKGIVWEVTLPPLAQQNGTCGKHVGPKIQQFCSFDLGAQDDLDFVIPVDPAGSAPVASEFLDTFAQDIAVSYTKSGVLCGWTARLNLEGRSVDWLVTSKVTTGIESPSLASGSSTRKFAVVNRERNGLTIWDSTSDQLEYEWQFATGETIQDLDWTSTPDDQSILAVGFPYKVRILTQIRYDYLDRGPAWASIREISTRDSTPHPIGDSTWLGSGQLVIGAGNQLFIHDKVVDSTDAMVSDLHIQTPDRPSTDLFQIVALLNGPLPVFHPQFLAQCILTGKIAQVQKVLFRLNRALNFFSEGDKLDGWLELPMEEFFVAQEMQSSYVSLGDDEPEVMTEELSINLQQNLAKLSVSYLSAREQMHLADIVECIATAEKHRRSMDENAMRYLLFFRQHMLRRKESPERQAAVTWREIAWAFHSGSQDILLDLVSRHFQGRMLWEHAKESGMFMWMTDIAALRAQFEVIARNEYTKTSEKNPIDCSLHYLALKKKNVLLGLWRMAGWHREQASTQKLLANDFLDPRWKTAALKNAYALLGKRRFEYAAAFFLLAGNLLDAVNVCAQQMEDIPLAIVIARVYEGDDGPVLRELLVEKVLPAAAFDGNRWLAMWAFWMLGRRDIAVRALISPVYDLLDTPESPSQESKSYLATDPALVVLYAHLRDKTLQTLKGASEISPRAEWEFVTQMARIYDRMGCDVLALDLVRNWEFLKPPPPRHRSIDRPLDMRAMLRRRSSLVVDDLLVPMSPKSPRMPRMPWSPTLVKTPGGLKAPPAMAFMEPDVNSLLDSFGF